MNKIIALLLCLAGTPALAQYYHGFEFGKVTYADMEMKSYPRDTSAYAVVLDEFGEGHVDNGNDNNLLFEYHVKIKILKKEGLKQADFSIPLAKSGAMKQKIKEVDAITYNIKNNQLTQTKMDIRKVVTNSVNEYWDEAVFALSDVVVGSVIEVRYLLESPFTFKFFPWYFQADIPKVQSEYWARIPGNYLYNVTLKGYLKLTSHESTIVDNCFTPGGGAVAACSLDKYKMVNIPAFTKEEYMTASSNFLSAIVFELSELKHFNGVTRKFTKTWKDVDRELILHDDFGPQIKKARNLFEKVIIQKTMEEIDPAQKARIVYQHIQDWYQWSEEYSKYSRSGVKNAYDTRKGNVGDINLSLVGALQAAGLETDPVILATREVGLPNSIYPVMTDFNYVVAYVKIGSERVMLDATDPLLPFGVLPIRCFNGKGRLIGRDETKSDWVDIKPIEKRKKNLTLTLTLDEKGLSGDVSIVSYGYEAYEKRKAILLEQTQESYVQKLTKELVTYEVTDYEVQNLKDINQPLIEKMKVKRIEDSTNPSVTYVDPFFMSRWGKNPFKSTERLYPVDFGAPLETTYLLNLTYSPVYVIDEAPENTALALPNSGGRYLFNVNQMTNKIAVTNVLNISKMVYTSAEYGSLKELFNRVVQSQSVLIALKRQ